MAMSHLRETVADYFNRGIHVVVIIAATLCVITLILRALVHFPIIDETNHAHYLWLVSEGLRPGPDFFCSYPVLYYLVLAPFFKMFPESAYVLLVLRLTSVVIVFFIGLLLYRHGRRVTGDGAVAVSAFLLMASFTGIGPFLVEFSVDPAAALLAVAAMTLMFRPPTFRRVAAVSGLSLLSVAVTPKYAFGLFFGLLGYAAADWLDSRRLPRTIAAVGFGGSAASLVVLGLYRAYGISLPDNVRTAVLLTMRIVPDLPVDIRLSVAVLLEMLHRPLFAAVVLLGLAGWVRRSWTRPERVNLPGAGILLGTFLFLFRTNPWYEQYQTVVYVTMAVFAPYAFDWIRDGLASRAARFALAASVLTAVSLQVPPVMGEFGGTNINRRDTARQVEVGPPAMASLLTTNFLLRTIPRDERVVAVWFHSPLFRRDLTPVSTDDRPSLVTVMSPDDPARALFDPEYFRGELERRPPALIDLNQTTLNYPPGWAEAARDFLVRNQELYTPIPSLIVPEFNFFIRKDLLSKGPR